MSPFEMADELGVNFDLFIVSPEAVGRALQASATRQLEQAAAASLRKQGFLSVLGGPLTHASAEPICRALASRTGLTPLERGSLRAIASGAVWTRQRLHAAGYEVSEKCPLCSSGRTDTIFHRAWECAATADLRAKNPDLALWARQSGPESILFSTGWVEQPAAFPGAAGPASELIIDTVGFCDETAEPIPAQGRSFKPGDDPSSSSHSRDAGLDKDPSLSVLSGDSYSGKDPGTPTQDHDTNADTNHAISAMLRTFDAGPIYTDGSCLPHVFKGLSRAAWAAVQVDDRGGPLRSGSRGSCLRRCRRLRSRQNTWRWLQQLRLLQSAIQSFAIARVWCAHVSEGRTAAWPAACTGAH